LETSKPDYLEVLPGVMPDIIKEVKVHTNLPIIAGGFIRTQEDIATILASGATAVTTSHRELWQLGSSAIKKGMASSTHDEVNSSENTGQLNRHL
jgi:F0F1-type ATP synthase epsilon subunit